MLRHAVTTPMADLVDLDTLTGAARRALDPEALAAAQAEGYAAGREAGYRDGLEAGRRDAAAELQQADQARAEAVAAALAALEAATAEVAAQAATAHARLEDALAGAALDLATALLGRELELASDPGRDAIARALRLVDGPGAAIARLHPDDVATLADRDALSELAVGRELTVVADPSVERGGCILDIGEGRVDARLSTAVERVREVLAP